jgi:hypothetical protein
VADDQAERGLTLLEQALQNAPERQAAQTILALAEGLAKRHK